MATVNGSFTSPLAIAQWTFPSSSVDVVVAEALGQLTVWNSMIGLLCFAVFWDQVRYIWQKKGIVGPSMKIPFMGPFLEAVYPVFTKYQEKWASGELSCVSVFHKFVVIASTRDMSRKIFNSPSFVRPCVVDIATKLLRPENWVFLDGKAHVDYRKGLNGLFTRQALDIYLPGQEEVYDKYFALWLAETEKNGGKPKPWMSFFRELMTAVSCRTFVGHYMNEATVKKIAVDYFNITAALDLVNFPIIIPFTRTWYGKKAADMVIAEFAKCAAKSKVRMAAGGEVTCILDAWVKQMQDSARYNEKIAQGIPVDPSEKPPQVLREFSDLEIGMTLMTFLFASQDATSSACTWLFQILAQRPDVLDKVRAENLQVRNGDRNHRLVLDELDLMTYTHAVVKETLRYRPPVIMVPYEVKKNFQVTHDFKLRKGQMIVPSIWPATHDPDAYPDPDTFNVDRWITGDAEKQVKNFLVFGTGPHYCLGQQYARSNLALMIGKASMHLNWAHHPTPVSEVIKVFATIFPSDDCPLTFERRPADVTA